VANADMREEDQRRGSAGRTANRASQAEETMLAPPPLQSRQNQPQNGPPPPTSGAMGVPEYANVNCRSGGQLTLEASDGYLVPNTPISLNFPTANEDEDDDDDQHGAASPVREEVIVNGREYANVRVEANATDQNGEEHEDDEEEVRINYVAVDLKPNDGEQHEENATASMATAAPPLLPSEYCTIDIDRTKALNATARQTSQRAAELMAASEAQQQKPSQNGTKKKSSTLSELTGLVKRNSIID